MQRNDCTEDPNMPTPTAHASDLASEPLIRLRDVPNLSWLPRSKKGRPIHFRTAYLWARRGLHGKKLQTVRVGNALCTSEAALRRFFAALSVTTPHREGVADGD